MCPCCGEPMRVTRTEPKVGELPEMQIFECRLCRLAVTAEHCGWNEAPRYLIRNRDGAYGETFIRRLEAMGIRDRPSSARSPWQNGHAERLIGSIRRDCLDHVVVFGERHLRHLLNSYQRYYNEVRTHLSLQKDAPIPRTVRNAGRIVPVPILGGLHHQYVRV